MKTHEIDIRKLRANPANKAIFEDFEPHGRDRWFSESIKSHGIREPLLITEDGLIIDGHRRFYAAQVHKISAVPCRFLSTAEEAKIAFQAAQLARNKTAFAKVQLYYDRIAELVDRSKAKQKANLAQADDFDDDQLENDWEEFEQVLGVKRDTLLRIVRLIREIDELAADEKTRDKAERLRSTLRNHGVRPTLRLMGEKPAASDDEPDLGDWERHNDPKTRPGKTRPAKPEAVEEEDEAEDDEPETVAFEPPADEPWQEIVHRYCDEIEQIFLDNDAHGRPVKTALTALRNFAPLPQKAAA